MFPEPVIAGLKKLGRELDMTVSELLRIAAAELLERRGRARAARAGEAGKEGGSGE